MFIDVILFNYSNGHFIVVFSIYVSIFAMHRPLILLSVLSLYTYNFSGAMCSFLTPQNIPSLLLIHDIVNVGKV